MLDYKEIGDSHTLGAITETELCERLVRSVDLGAGETIRFSACKFGWVKAVAVRYGFNISGGWKLHTLLFEIVPFPLALSQLPCLHHLSIWGDWDLQQQACRL
jgi:hypothetical protein